MRDDGTETVTFLPGDVPWQRPTPVDAYGTPFEPEEVIDAIIDWQRRCAAGIEDESVRIPAMAELVADGTAARIRAAAEWTASHRIELAHPAHHEPR